MRPRKTEIQKRATDSVVEKEKKEHKEYGLIDVSVISGAAGISLTGLIALGYYLISTVPSILIPFVVGAALPLFTLFAIIYQAVVYRRQWHVMRDSVDRTDTIIEKMQGQLDATIQALEIERAKTEPRLQITNVRVVNLRPDESPIFLLSIRNIGALDAEETLINLRVSFGRSVDPEGTMAQKLTAPQTVTIPAGQEHTYAIPWDGPITKEHIERLNRMPLKVSGFIKPKDEAEREFCYRYYAIKGDRPPGMPEFVPCDFDTRLTKVVTAGSIRLKLEPHPPNIVTDEVQKDSEKENDD